MSFARASFTARRTLVSLSFAPPKPDAKKPSNLPLWLGGAGIAGISLYLYLEKGPGAQKAKAEPAAPKKGALDPKNFIDFELKKVEPYNHNTAKFVFALPPDTAADLPVASCVVVQSSPDHPAPLKNGEGKPVIRPYTPILPDAEGEITFLIKRYDNGLMSKHIHELKPGEKLAIKGPIPKFPFKVNEFEEVGMVAGGSGITPMHQILLHALNDPSNKTRFTLIFANISERDILLREEFDKLRKEHPDTFNVIYTLDKPGPDWKGPTGYVNKEMIAQHIAPPSLAEKVKIFVCGPPGQVAALAGKKAGMKQGELGGILKELGYTEDQVFKF
ncbi:cytochrome-b5 reductase [Obba rivulosa]|uniref:NADH-cytochrome b5 reductase n=1 Tax=Obba rivulosa TaxID=1052685 RepID=A0A8E2DJ65_9APHY|nr:cytochrome-b5 reductase [Obba rivulosa]